MITHYKHFIFSQDPDALVTFYRDCLGMEVTMKLEHPEDYGYELKVLGGEQTIWLAKRSGVEGKSKDPYRTILNLYVDSVQTYYDKAMAWEGVEVVAEPFAMETKNPDETRGRWAATVLDPDGNCVQFMGIR